MKRRNVWILPFAVIATSMVLLISLSGCVRKVPEDPHTLERTIISDGLLRTYRMHIPPNLPENSTPALLLVLHGGGGTGEGMERSLTLGGFNTFSDEQDVLIVYPDGIEKNWNDGRTNVSDPAHEQQIDDVGFFTLLMEELSEEFSVDPHRIFVTGISNGAMMSYRLAIELPEKIAAIAPVAGALPIDLVSFNMSNTPVSVCVLSGTQDPLVPWEGGLVGFPRNPRGIVLSVQDSVMYWVEHNNCVNTPNSTLLPDSDPKDKTWVQQDIYSYGQNNTEVVLYMIYNGGHTWPDGLQYLPESLVGRTTHDINANNVIWDFFLTHPKE